jgi:hypothetical protein
MTLQEDFEEMREAENRLRLRWRMHSKNVISRYDRRRDVRLS